MNCFYIFWQIHYFLNLIDFPHLIRFIFRMFFSLLCVTAIRKIENRNRNIVFSEIQRELRYCAFAWIIRITAILKLHNKAIYIEVFKVCLLFQTERVATLKTGYFGFILLAYSLKIFSNYLGSCRNHIFASFTELANQSNIKGTCLILIIILGIWIISTSYWIKIIGVNIFMLFEEFLNLLSICIR